MTYRYTIDGTDVNPRGDWVLNLEQGDGQIFFRRKLRGDLTFIGDDYDLIMASSDCDVLEFKIFCGAAEHWEGKFKFPYDFDIDEDSCACVGEPEVVDEYSCIMDFYETEWRMAMATGPIQPVINDCAAGAIYTMTNVFFPLGVPGAVSTDTGHLNHIINSSNRMNCGLTLASSFLWRSNFANGDNYAAAYGTNNYITGAGNRLEYIYLGPNTNIRFDFGGTVCDGTAYYSFKDYEELLRNRFNAYWYIDQNGDFRIEHIRFFDAAFANSDFETGINLKTLISSNGKSFAYRRNKYTYETGRLYDQEFFSWQHWDGTEGGVAHGSDFQGVPIFYGAAQDQKSDCVPGVFKERDMATPRFWTDIDWGWGLRANPPAAGGSAQPDIIQCPGFLMLDVDTTAANHINCEVGIFSGVNGMNRHLSTANLQEHYFTWDRMFLDGDMNFGGATPRVLFDSEIRKQLQEAIEFEHCCDTDFNPLDFVETELGSGRVKAATEKKRSIDIELLY